MSAQNLLLGVNHPLMSDLKKEIEQLKHKVAKLSTPKGVERP